MKIHDYEYEYMREWNTELIFELEDLCNSNRELVKMHGELFKTLRKCEESYEQRLIGCKYI